MKKHLLTIACVIISVWLHAQDFSNKGKDFWIGYGHHIRMLQTNQAESMQLYITSDVSTTGKVEIASIGFSQNFTVTANQITTVNIPRTAALIDEGSYDHGIHVTANNSVVVYSFIYVSAVSGATLCLPTNVLGRDYYSVNYTQLSNEGGSYSYFFVIATEDNTQVEIKPTQATKGGKPANVAFTVNLNKGQIYQVLSASDLTGSTIKSISSSSGGCKRIGVYCGSGKISIGCTGSASSSDNLYQQIYPNNSWGKKYITTPSTNVSATTNSQTNFFRIIRPDASSIVKLNGAVVPSASFVNGFYYQFNSNTTNVIESDKAILVAQYFTTSGNGPNCGNSGIGDPEMIYLNPIEQTISKVTLNSMQPSANTALTTHFINVVLKNTPLAINTFKIDGVSYSNKFLPVSQDPAYAYARINIASQGHTVTCDSGFNAIAYGFGSAESYGYSAGANVVDLYQYVTVQNQFATVNFPSTCRGTPFTVAITLPYQPTSLTWDFGNNPNLSPNNNVVNNKPIEDTFFVKDGKTLYQYKLSGNYSFSSAGIYTVKVIANNPTPDGCSGIQEINYDLQVFDPPIAKFNLLHSGCITDSVYLSDATDALGRTITKWLWDFGDGTIDSVKNPVKKFLLPNTYNVRLKPITDIGCIGDTVKALAISATAVPKFGISDTTCIGSTINFSDSSTIAVGTIVKWYWDYGNGLKDTLTASSPTTQVYTSAGAKTVSLIVESNTGCKSNPYTATVNIRPLPVPDFSLPIACLPVGAAAFKDTSTISDNTQADFKYKWQFGDGGVDSIKNPVHNYATVGPFNVQLTVTSKYGCIKDTTKQYNTIYQQPKALATVSTEVCLRDSTSFTDASDGKGSTITKWKWTFADGDTDTLPKTKHKYATAKTYNASLFVTTDKGCISDTITVATIVNPLPTAGFKYATGPICEQRPIAFTDTSKANVGSLTRFSWSMGNGRLIDTANGGAFNETYAAYKSYTVRLMVENSKGCKSDTVQKTLVVNPLPQVGFITPEVCLSDAAAFFSDTSKIADGSEAQFLYSWSFIATNANPTVLPTNYPVATTSTTIKNPQVQYKQASNYFVTETVTSNNGCAVTKTQPFTVNGASPLARYRILKPASLCANDSIYLKDSSFVDFGSITKVEIYWDNANSPTVIYTDNNPFPGKIYSHKYPDFQVTTSPTKAYNIKYVVYSGGICGDDSVQTITVNATPKVRFTTLPGICNDTTARQITQATETSGLAGLNNGSFMYSGTGVNTTGLYTPGSVAAGTYAIQYKYTNNIGCADSATQLQTVWPSPVAKWGYSSVTCEKNDIVFTDSSVANYKKIKTWVWTYGDGNTATKLDSLPYSYKYITANTYNATLRITTDSGCHAALTKAIKVNYLPVVDFTLPSVCLPDGNGTFTSTSTVADNKQLSFRWYFDDPNNSTVSTSSPANHRFSALAPTGGYQVKLIVTVPSTSCTDSLTKSFTTVYPQPKASFTSAKAEVCMKNNLRFINTSDTVSNPVNKWVWDLAQGNASSAKDASRNFNDSGLYNISLHFYNARGCVSDTAKGTVEVHPYPYLDLGPDLLVLEGGSIPLKPLFYYGNNLSYLWTTLTPPTYLDKDTVLVPISTPAIFLDVIQYKLTLTAKGGCTVSDSLILKILHAPDVPNAFSPNGDNVNDKWVIKNLENYPGCSIEIFNRYGQLIFSKTGFNQTNAWDGTFNGQPVPIGTYYYIIDPKNGRAKVTGNVTVIR